MKTLLIALLFIAGLSQAQPIRISLPGSGTGSGGSSSTPAQIRAALSAGQGLGYDANLGQFYLNNAVLNTQIGNYLKSREGFAPNKMLQSNSTGDDFVWVTPTSSGTTTTPPTNTAVTALSVRDSVLLYADSTLSRFNPATATVVSVTSVAQLQTLLTTTQSNKDFVMANGTYPITADLAQTSAWTNVRLRAQTRGGVTFSRANYSTVWIFNDGQPRTKVSIDGIRFVSSFTGSGNPIVWNTELVPSDGIEYSYCEITSGGAGVYNGLNIQQYSVGSNSGQVGKNFYIHNCYIHDIGRANEFLTQGYDYPRLFGVVFAYNRFENMGVNDQHGFGISLSGLIKYVLEYKNTFTNCRNVSMEFVNAQYCLAKDNIVTNPGANATTGYGISDDGVGSTRYILIEGGSLNTKGRPFYAYDSRYVFVDGGTWYGNRGVDMNVRLSQFKNINVTIHSSQVESGWQFGGTSNNNTMTNVTLTSAGAKAAGFEPNFESVVLRSGTFGNTLTDVTTTVGLKADNTPYAPTNSGGNGAIVNQGTGTPSNQIVRNIYGTAP